MVSRTEAAGFANHAGRRAGEALMSLLWPSACAVCNLPLLHAQLHPVCTGCMDRFRDPLPRGCARCSEPFGYEPDWLESDRVCDRCRQQPPEFVRATAYGAYSNLRPAIFLLKFQGVRVLARPLGKLLAKAMLQHRDSSPAELTVIPVPVFHSRRSYNQSLLLAESALEEIQGDGWILRLRPELLTRIHHAESMFDLSAEERLENIRGAFEVRGDVSDLHVLIVDDIFTTGCTAGECARILLRAGAASVRVATLARTTWQEPERWRPTAQRVAPIPAAATHSDP